MFERYVDQDDTNERRRRWLSVLIGASVLAHVVVIIAVMIAGMWNVDKNPYKDTDDGIKIRALHAGVVAPPPLGSKTIKNRQNKLKIPKKLVHNRQPTDRRATIKFDPGAIAEDGPGRKGGKLGGTGDDPTAEVTSLTACRDGEICGTGVPRVAIFTPPKPPELPKPKIVLAHLISGSRIAGESQIKPPKHIAVRIFNDGNPQVIGGVLMCLNTSGRVSSIKLTRPTGYEAYDAKILREVRAWRYKPFRVNNTAIPVCTSITFIYRQE